MKKLFLFLALCLFSSSFSSSRSPLEFPPPDGRIDVYIQGITGNYPFDWEDYEIWIYMVDENENEYSHWQPSIYNGNYYCWNFTVDNIYWTITPRLKKNGEHVPKEVTLGYGYLDPNNPIVCTILWADED